MCLLWVTSYGVHFVKNLKKKHIGYKVNLSTVSSEELKNLKLEWMKRILKDVYNLR